MDVIRAKEIIAALAEGIDPTTGEMLADDNVCNKAEVVRAFYTVLQNMENSRPKKELPENAGKPWTQDEEKVLLELYNEGLSKKEISQQLGRTLNSIMARLLRLGILDA